jgi:hypothetical protein
MYDAIVRECNPIGPFYLDIKRIAGKQVYLTDQKPPAVIASWMSGDQRGWLGETDEPVMGRYEYDEPLLERAHGILTCDMGNCAWVAKPDIAIQYKPIEVLVSLNKVLHYRMFPNAGKWYFTRLELDRPLEPSDTAALKVLYEHMLAGRFTRAMVGIQKTWLSTGPGQSEWTATEPIGTIGFAAVK